MICLIFLSLCLIALGLTGLLNVPKSPVEQGIFEGSQLLTSYNASTDLLLGHIVLLNPNLGLQVFLTVEPQHYQPCARGTIKVLLERCGISLESSSLEKEINFFIEQNESENFTLTFYTTEENYFELEMYEVGISDPVYVHWHVEVVTLDFGLATFSPLLIITGFLMLLELIRFKSFLLSSEVNITRHGVTIFIILVGMLILPAYDFARSLYYLSLGQKPISLFPIFQFIGSLAILSFPLVIYIYTPEIMKRKYKLKKLTDYHEIARFLSQKFNGLTVYLFESDDLNAYLVGITKEGPEVSLTTGLIKEFQSGNINQEDIANIVSHEIGHIVDLDLISWNFCRILLAEYKYWVCLYVTSFWLSQLVRVNPYGWVAPIVYLSSPEFLGYLLAGIHLLLKGDFAAAKIVLPMLDINVLGTFISTLLISFALPHFLLSSAIRESELAADKSACSYFTSKESMIRTIKKITAIRTEKIMLMNFARSPTYSERIRNLEAIHLGTDLLLTARDSLAIGVLSFALFKCFCEPFLTLFILPLFGISFFNGLRNFFNWSAEVDRTKTSRKVLRNLKSLSLQSFISGLAYSVILLLVSFTDEELLIPANLAAVLAIGLLYIPLASLVFSAFLLFLYIISAYLTVW